MREARKKLTTDLSLSLEIIVTINKVRNTIKQGFILLIRPITTQKRTASLHYIADKY